MDHDFHRVIKFIKLVAIFFRERDPAETDFAVNDDERDRFNRFALAGSLDAQAGLDLKLGLVSPAPKAPSVVAKKPALANIQPCPLMRARIDIAKILIVDCSNHKYRKWPRSIAFRNARQAERFGLAAVQTAGGADYKDLYFLPHSPTSY
jgi:hypothetical protein